MAEINMIFRGSMSITSRTQGKKLQLEISLAQHIEPGRRMKWSDDYITFRPEDHPIVELSERNLPLVVKIPIGWPKHWLIAGLIESYNEKDLHRDGPQLIRPDPVHDTFHRVILGQASTPIGCIDLEISCGTGENKCREMLTFEVASFDIGYNCILGRPFRLKFMAVIHTAYAIVKMSGPRG
jgi:hypothetical protein